MKREIIYSFTDDEIRYAIYKVTNGMQLDEYDARALVYGAEKWVEFKDECSKDPSYQWGYGHTYY